MTKDNFIKKIKKLYPKYKISEDSCYDYKSIIIYNESAKKYDSIEISFFKPEIKINIGKMYNYGFDTTLLPMDMPIDFNITKKEENEILNYIKLQMKQRNWK